MIKEVGWPLEVGDALGLDDGRIKARVVMAQGRQNTNYGINLYACHPFFIQGIATMTNGENTAFVPIKEWLTGQEIPGYIGYQSDSEVFTHILHYVTKKLKLPLEAYKHVITPLKTEELDVHPQGDFLKGLRTACRRLIIDGPNAVIGTLPDETCMLVMDHKKMRPATVGGKPGDWAIASEMCGVDAMIPDRDRSLDFQPMREHTVIIPPDRKELVDMVSVRSICTSPSSLTYHDLPWIIEHREDRCTLCGRCTSVCPVEAIYLTYRRQRMPKLDYPPEKARQRLPAFRRHPAAHRSSTNAASAAACAPWSAPTRPSARRQHQRATASALPASTRRARPGSAAAAAT